MGECKHIWPKQLEASEWLEDGFTGKKRPNITTVQRWIVNGNIPGKKVGSKYFVWVDQHLNLVEPVDPDLASVVGTGNEEANIMLTRFLSRTASDTTA
jgi:hypothetical protein